MKHWIYPLLFALIMAFKAQAVVSVQVTGSSLKVQVKPYAPVKPYESWYRIRRDAEGDRFGKREFWMNDSKEEQYYSFKEICQSAVKAQVLDFEINSQTLDSKDMWAKFNCLRLDADAMTIVYPDLQKFLAPHMTALNQIAKKYNDEAMKFNFQDPNYEKTSNASNALYQLLNYILNSKDSNPWLKNPLYREALIKGTVKEFEKKRWAGKDPVITKPLVLVTHATTIFDDKSIKTFADQTIREAKAKGLPVVYLVSDDGVHDQTWYLEDKNPDRAYFSKNGEHSVMYSSNTVIMMGGFYNQCLRTSQLDLITRHFMISQEALTIHLPIRGIYVHDSIDFTKITKAQFLERVKEGSILGGYEVDDDHGGMVESDMNKLTGVPDLKQYTVNIYADDQLVENVGTGSRVVNLKFWSHNQFMALIK
ncbi:hypothetical protein [Pseudobdellovibrio sp. HCB154]|uniref:hypothetical protein n=1 Tax=Pseudobdellovibrio sp. HCB154 TaxID=3386277 RepID=UPI003916F279